MIIVHQNNEHDNSLHNHYDDIGTNDVAEMMMNDGAHCRRIATNIHYMPAITY